MTSADSHSNQYKPKKNVLKSANCTLKATLVLEKLALINSGASGDSPHLHQILLARHGRFTTDRKHTGTSEISSSELLDGHVIFCFLCGSVWSGLDNSVSAAQQAGAPQSVPCEHARAVIPLNGSHIHWTVIAIN